MGDSHYSPFRDPFAAVEERFAAFTEALEEHGIEREAGRFAVNRVTYVAETDEKAWEVMPVFRG